MKPLEKAYCLWFLVTIVGLLAALLVVATTKSESGVLPANFFLAMLFGLFPTGVVLEIALRGTHQLLTFRLPVAVRLCLIFTGGLWLLTAVSLSIRSS